MAYVGMTYLVLAYVVMTYIVMACIVMACIVIYRPWLYITYIARVVPNWRRRSRSRTRYDSSPIIGHNYIVMACIVMAYVGRACMVRHLSKKWKVEKGATFELLFLSKVAPSRQTSERSLVDLCCKATFELLFATDICKIFMLWSRTTRRTKKVAQETRKVEEEK